MPTQTPVRRVLGLTRISLAILLGFELVFLFLAYGIWLVVAFQYCGNQEGCARKDLLSYLLGAVMAGVITAAVPFAAWRGTKHPVWKWLTVGVAFVVLGWFGVFGAFVQ